MKAPCNRQTSIIGIFGGRPSAGCSSLTARQTAIAASTQCNRHHLHPHHHQCLHVMTSKHNTMSRKEKHFYPSLQVVEVEIFSCSKSSTLSLKVKVDLFQFVAKLECSGSQSLATCGWEQLPVTDLHLNLHHLHPSRFQTKPSPKPT